VAEGIEGGAESEVEPEEPMATNDLGVTLALLEADRAEGAAQLKKEAAAFLADQRKLISHQLHHLVVQFKLLKLKVLGERLRLALQGLSIAFVTVILVIFGRLVFDAMNDHSLTIQGFSTTPALEAQGFSAHALAEDLMHRVNAIRQVADDHSFDYSGEVHGQEAEELKVEIPGAGISLDAIESFIRRSMGHQVPVNGDLRLDADGKAVMTIYVGTGDPIRVEAAGNNMEHLAQEAAERVFQRFDPENYCVYLEVSPHRHAEALAAARNYVAVAKAEQRTDTYSLLANSMADKARAEPYARLATELDPTFIYAWFERTSDADTLGHDEEALAAARRILTLRRQDQPERVRRATGFDYIQQYARRRVALETADYRTYETLIDGTARTQSYETLAGKALSLARVRALTHDDAGARAALARAALVGNADPDEMDTVTFLVDSMAGRWPQARATMEGALGRSQASLPSLDTDDEKAGLQTQMDRFYHPWHALAVAHTGDAAAAWAEISATPLDCYLCLYLRGSVAAIKGDADYGRWFYMAVRQNPDIPFAYKAWGEALLMRGDKAGARLRFEQAAQIAPRWADPRESLKALSVNKRV